MAGLLRHVALLLPPAPGNIEVTGPPRRTARYAGFRAVADERNGSPTALMQSLKHYKVLHEHDVIRHALWLTISCGRNSAFGGTAVMRRTSLNGSEVVPAGAAIAMAQNSLSQNTYYGV